MEEKKQTTKAPLVRNKPGQVDEAPFGKSSAKKKLGRGGASQAEERARPFETSQPSRPVPTPLEPVSVRAEKASQAEKVEPKASSSGWASRYAETTSNDKSQEKLQRSEESLVSGKEAASTGASRDVSSDQDGQGSKTTPVAGKGESTFKQRVQEGLGISQENNLLKPLKSKFSGANNEQTSQPFAEDTQALQTDGTTRPYQQADSPMTLEKPVKEFKPYTVSKSSVVSGSKPDVSKNKMPFVQEWPSSSNRETPSRPERPQDELFMGVSESNSRPNPSLGNTSALGISQPSSFADSKAKQKSPRDFIVPVSEVKTDRPDPAMTRKPAEAVQPGKTEQDSREYTLVTARSPVNLSSDSSKRGKTETSAVRVVSGIIERPREIEIQKPSQTDKATRPSKRENQPLKSAVEMFDAVTSRKRKSTETKEIESLPGDATQSLQVADQSTKQKKDLGNRSRDQGRIVDSSETRKLATVDDQEPKPRFADSIPVGGDTTNSPRRINGNETFTSESTKLSVPEESAFVDADASNKSGLLGRWTGRGKKDMATEQTKRSPTNQPPLATTATPVVSSFTSVSNAQKVAKQEASEVGVSTVRSDEFTREVPGTRNRPVMETPSNDLLASGATQEAASGSLAGGNFQEKDSSPSIFKSPISDSQHDVPAPLFMGGHKLVLKEAAPKSREGFVPYSPPEAERQISAKERPADRNIADRDMLYTSQTEKSNVTSPEMPSQEDFFKQMRQSIMFQNADTIKMDVTESTDAATKRKSRRNRNFSISGLQPARETVVPDLPTLSNPEQRSAVGGGNSIAHSDVAQAALSSRLESTSCKELEGRETLGSDLASGSHVQPSMAQPREEGGSNMQPSAPVLSGQLGAESSISPQIRSGGSERTPAAGLSPSPMPTRVDAFVSPQPGSSSLPSGARVGPATATEMAQCDVPDISTIERKIPNVFNPVTVTEDDHVDGTKQADLHSFDLKDKSWSPLEPTFSGRRPEQALDIDRSILAASRDTEYNEPNEKVPRPRTTEAERMPLHPAPSSAGIFRRPSFGDKEGLQHPMTTRDLPPAQEHNDPKIQSFFDGIFKSKETEDLALELGSAHLTERELTSDNQAGKPSFDDSVKEIPRSPQTQPPVEDIGSRALKEVSSSPSTVPENSQPIGIDSGLSEIDPRSPPAFHTLTRTQVPKQDVNVNSTPMTPFEPGTRGVEYFDAPRDLSTSRSPEASGLPIQEKATDMSSPYSAEIPVLVVEDLAAHPLSRNGDTASHSKSPEALRELEQQWGKPKLNDATISPRMDHGNLGSFATKHREEENQVPQTVSGSIQGKEPSQLVVTPHTASETNFQDFVKEGSPEQQEFLVGNSHVNDEFINSDNSRDAQGGVGQTEVFPHRAPEIAMHEDRQKGSDSPSLSAGYLEQVVAPTSFDSTSHQEARGILKNGESWAPIPAQKTDHATLSMFNEEPESLKSNEYRDHVNTNHLPDSNLGPINSPQESDPDLSDHILSLYDGSESVPSDNLVTGGFHQHAPSSSERQDAWPVIESAHTKSLSDFHSSVTDNRTSILSVEPLITEIPNITAHPSDAKDSWVPKRSVSRLSTSELIAGSSPPAQTPTRDPSNPANAQTENVTQELPKAAGLKDRLRMFFSKTDNSEPDCESHAQPVANSSVYESIQSTELFGKPTVLRGESDIANEYASPTFESPIDETGHGRNRVPFEGGNIDPPRAEDKMNHGFLSSNMVEEEYPSQQAMSPEPHHIHTPHLNEAEKEVSPLRSAYSPEPMPAIASPEHRDSPLPTYHAKEERLFPYHDRSLSASPSVPGDDDGHVSYQDGSHTQSMEEFDPQGVPTPRDGEFMRTTSRPDSRIPGPINASTSLRDTPDLDDTRQDWSPQPEEEHNMFNSTVDKLQAFDPISPQMEPMSESHIQNKHLPNSPESTAHYANNDEFRDAPMYEDEKTGFPTSHSSEPEISSPDLAHKGFQSGKSPLLEDTKHWANNDIEPNQDRHQDSPWSDHMDAGPSNFMDKREAAEIHSPESESWNGSPVQTGSFSPAVKAGDHDRDDAMMMSSAEPDFDTATTYSDHHDVPNDHFTAEHGNARDDFDDTPNNDFSGEDYEDRNRGFEHPGANGSSFGNDEIQDEVDNFGGNHSPAQDFLGHHEELGGIESESYPVDHQPGNHEGGFDDIENDGLQTGNFSARPDTFDRPRMENYPADHQSHEGDFDDFQDNRVPADDFNDRQDTFDSPRIESYPADHQSYGVGFNDFQDDSLPADDFNNRPQTFDGPEMENYPADQQSHEGGFGNFEGDRHSAEDFLDRPETHGSPTMGNNYAADHQSHLGEFDDFQDNGLPAGDFHDRPETFESPMMDNYPAVESPLNDDGFENHHGPGSDVYQDDIGGVGEVQMDHYPADGPPSPVGGFEDSGVDNYPNDDFQRNSGTFGSAEMGPADEFPYDTAEPNNSAFDNYDADYPDANHGQYSEPMVEDMPAYEQGHDAGYPSGGVDEFNPGHDDTPYNEGSLSDYGGDQGPGFDQEPEPFADDNFQGNYPQDSPLDDGHLGGDDFAGPQPDFDGHGDGMDFNDNREGDFDEVRGDDFDNQDYGADIDHGLGGDIDHGEPGWEGDAEPANFDEGGFGGEAEPFAEDWAGDQMDGGRGLDEVEEYPMDGGEDFPMDGGAEYPMDGEAEYPMNGEAAYPMDGGSDYPMDGGEEFPMDGGAEDYPLEGDESRFPDAMVDGDMPMGGEAEEYYMGGEGMQSPGPVDEGEFPMGGEADDYMMDGDGDAEYPMEEMDGGDEFPMDGDEELPIGEMYGEEDRSMGPIDDEEFPMGDGEASPMMEGEEYPMDQEDGLPMEGEEFPMDQEEGFPMAGEDFEGSDRGIEDFDGDGDDQFGDDMSDHGSMPEDVEGSDREIEDFDGDGQLEDDMSDHGSMPDEDQGSQFDDGSVDARSLIDEEAGSQIADEDAGSDASAPFDEETAGDLDAENEDLSPSEIEDREIQEEEAEDDDTSLAGEEDVDGEEEQNMDDLYEADVPSIPASPTSTEHDRELEDQDADGQDDEDDIFGEPALQDDLEDLENADPVRLSCLYMQDVGLMSSPSSPTVTQANGASEQNEAEVEEEQPREPVRFSALYRQSLDWSQALDSSMWENDDDDLPEEDEEQELTAPILEAVPESAKRQSQEELQMLEVDQEPLTPVAASPLSPRPLETPPPDYDHSNAIEARQLVEEPEELYKGAEDNGHQQYAVSPRLQPTPPPDQDQSSVSNDSQDDRRDSRGPQTFDEMNLPRRVISPPNTGDDDDDNAGGPSRTSTSYTNMPMHNRGRSISQRFSGWWSGGGSSAQVPARPPPLPAPYDSRYGEPSSPA